MTEWVGRASQNSLKNQREVFQFRKHQNAFPFCFFGWVYRTLNLRTSGVEFLTGLDILPLPTWRSWSRSVFGCAGDSGGKDSHLCSDLDFTKKIMAEIQKMGQEKHLGIFGVLLLVMLLVSSFFRVLLVFFFGSWTCQWAACGVGPRSFGLEMYLCCRFLLVCQIRCCNITLVILQKNIQGYNVYIYTWIHTYIFIYLHVHIIHWNILWYLFRNSSHTSWGKDSKSFFFKYSFIHSQPAAFPFQLTVGGFLRNWMGILDCYMAVLHRPLWMILLDWHHGHFAALIGDVNFAKTWNFCWIWALLKVV